jgi:hypothetical protein
MGQRYYDKDEIFLCVHWLADEFGERREVKFSELLDRTEEFERLTGAGSMFLADYILGHWESQSLIDTKTLPELCSDGVYYDYSISILCPTEALRKCRPVGPIDPHGETGHHPMPRGMKLAD